MTSKQMDLWAGVQTSVTEARYHDGLSLEQLANAIADNLDVAEIDVLAFLLKEEGKKKVRDNELIH